MSREHQGGIITDMRRSTVLAIFVGSIALGACAAWLAKTALGLSP